jgi:two-component system chemotaxis response regulator CheY
MSGVVLLVEDDQPLREVMFEALQMEGFDAAIVCNGAEAMHYLRSSPHPKLILLDLMMPVMDGAQFRQEQRANPSLCEIPVVLLSADRELADKAWALEVDAYLRKPVDLDELVKTVRRYTR